MRGRTRAWQPDREGKKSKDRVNRPLKLQGCNKKWRGDTIDRQSVNKRVVRGQERERKRKRCKYFVI